MHIYISLSLSLYIYMYVVSWRPCLGQFGA